MSEERIVTVLNVDDYPAGRYATTRVLRQAGYQVIEAGTGAEALEQAERQPDLIILDVNLPDVSGFEVARRIKSAPGTSAIPVLQMSAAYRDPEHRVQGLEEGADAYLAQPVEPRELLATVRALLRVRQAESVVRESEERFRAVVAATADIMWTADAAGSNRSVLPRWSALTAQTAGEAAGAGWTEALHPDDQERAVREWEEAVRTRGVYDTEYRLRMRDGSYRYFTVRGVPVLESSGAVREWVGVCVDVDEQKRTREREHFFAEASSLLASSLNYEETLARVAHLAVPALADWCVVHVRDEDGGVRLLALAHTDPARVQAARALQERFPAAIERRYEMALDAVRGGTPVLVPELTDERLRVVGDEEEVQAIRRFGIRSYLTVPLVAREQVLGALTFLTAESGRTLGAVDLAFAEELARRASLAIDNARLYSAALVASQAKTDFMATMSHELRTPMNAIIGYADLLDAEVAGPLNDRQREQLARITASSRHLLQLIDEILTFSRIEAGREAVRLERFDAGDLVRQTAALVEPLAHTKRLGFPVRAPGEPLWMESDPGKVRQILLNLLGNAVKFTDSGEVGVAVRVQGEEVRVEVHDTGIGIPGEQLEKVFDPFWQVEQAPSRRVGGTGLGLSVTRHLARLLGGDVTVASTPGQGSTFTVRLPLHAPPPDGAEG